MSVEECVAQLVVILGAGGSNTFTRAQRVVNQFQERHADPLAMEALHAEFEAAVKTGTLAGMVLHYIARRTAR